MTYYIQLVYMRACRQLRALGFYPWMGLGLGLFLFVIFSCFLFYKTSFAPWLYVLVAVSLLFKLNDSFHTDTLSSIFSKRQYYEIRLLENMALALPFIIFLIYRAQYWPVSILLFAVIGMAFFKSNSSINLSIPTPFKKMPFEFIVGFRKSIPFILLAYFLLLKAIQVANFNLGLFALILLFLIAMSFYVTPEKSYFVWIYSVGSQQFLKTKLITGIWCMILLALPMVIFLIIFFASQYFLILVVMFFGLLLLSSMVLAKYSAFPKEMSIPQAVLYALSIMFPPLLLVIIPIFYHKALRRLDQYLI